MVYGENEEEFIDETTGAYSEAGLVIGEECFTTDRTKAQRNVHRYGVYNSDGSRLANTNPAFQWWPRLPARLRTARRLQNARVGRLLGRTLRPPISTSCDDDTILKNPMDS